MQRFKLFLASASTSVLMLPISFASAQGLADLDGGSGAGLGTLLQTLLAFSNTVLIPFIVGIGFLVFVWGMFQFFIAGGANDEAKEKGKSLMIWATLGFVLIFILWGIVNLLVGTTGLNDKELDKNPGKNNVTI